MLNLHIIAVIALAFLLDMIVGDPQNPLHPIRAIGGFIAAGVALFKKTGVKNPAVSFLMGACLSISTVVITFWLTAALLSLLAGVNAWLGFGANVALCYFTIAPKALKDESMRVYKALTDGDLQDARHKLAYIVGRDTANLDTAGVVRAAVETVAENIADGVVAPLMYTFIGGVPLGMAYKAVNTLDSMIGYHNDTFEYFGKFAAKLDDAANFIPARLAALFMIAATPATGGDAQNAWRIYRRDRLNHKSPNSAQTEAVCAGALGLSLGGDNYYGGALVHKPTIGDQLHEPAPEHIPAANRLVTATAFISIFFLFALGTLLEVVLNVRI